MPTVQITSALFFDAERRLVERDDPAAVRCEVRWLDVNGEEHTTYADVGR